MASSTTSAPSSSTLSSFLVVKYTPRKSALHLLMIIFSYGKPKSFPSYTAIASSASLIAPSLNPLTLRKMSTNGFKWSSGECLGLFLHKFFLSCWQTNCKVGMVCFWDVLCKLSRPRSNNWGLIFKRVLLLFMSVCTLPSPLLWHWLVPAKMSTTMTLSFEPWVLEIGIWFDCCCNQLSHQTSILLRGLCSSSRFWAAPQLFFSATIFRGLLGCSCILFWATCVFHFADIKQYHPPYFNWVWSWWWSWPRSWWLWP